MPNPNYILDDNRRDRRVTTSLSSLIINYVGYYMILFAILLFLSYLNATFRLEMLLDISIYLLFMVGVPILNGWILYHKKRLKAPQAFTSGFFLFFANWFFILFLFPIISAYILPSDHTMSLELPKVFVHLFRTTRSSEEYYSLFGLCFFYIAAAILGLLLIHLIFQSNPRAYRPIPDEKK